MRILLPLALGVAASLLVAPYSAAQAPAPTLRILYSFSSQNRDGAVPNGLVFGKNGVLCGTTQGGMVGHGTVFVLAPPASLGGHWNESTLHAFTEHNGDGASPEAGVIIGRNGALYGTTFAGGTSFRGTVFELQPPTAPGGSWTETILHSFAGGSDGGNPQSALIIGKSGALYGTTSSGGPPNSACNSGCGTVFEFTP